MGVDQGVKEGERKKRWILSIRTTADGRARLQNAAHESGRSLSDEIETRLQLSFQRDDAFGGSANAAFVNLLGSLIRVAEEETGASWRTDYATWDAVKQSLVREIDRRAPPQTKKTRRKSTALHSSGE